MLRCLTIFIALCTVWANGSALNAAAPQHHEGTVVSVAAKRLVIKQDNGKEQSFDVEAMAKITLNGKPGKLEDFEATMPVLVTTDEKGSVLAVSTIDRHKGIGSRQ